MENKEALDAWDRHLQDAMACCEHCFKCENTEEKKLAFLGRFTNGVSDKVITTGQIGPFLVENITIDTRYQFEQKVNKLEKKLKRIAATCGHPDAAEACRIILEICKE